jgi:LmbE family N-acetylglucosaminyl deacetylase/GT2 family glycosyltransferase/glycosyltransferase involved in cell wall biosynthesis
MAGRFWENFVMSIVESSQVPYADYILPAGGKVVVIAPHPDDEIFGCGGTLALHAKNGAIIRTIIVSSGEGGGDPEVRRIESCLAAEEMGLPQPEFWNLPDRNILFGEELVLRLEEVFREEQPDFVYAPSLWEVHPDHRAVSLSVVEAGRRAPSAVGKIAFYEVGAALRPNALVNITSVVDAKADAMRRFKSQLERQGYDHHVAGLNQFRSYTLGQHVTAAEAFEIVSASDISSQLLHLGSRWLFPGLEERKVSLSAVARPLVSIVVRSMDRPFLGDALASLAVQTWNNIEVLVVNARPEIHSVLPEQVGNIRIKLIQRGVALGRSAAGNVGLQEAVGQYIGFLDDDDWIMPSHISLLVGELEKNRGLVAAYSATVVKNEEEVVDRYAQEFNLGLLHIRNYLPIHSVLFRRNAAADCHFDESQQVYEDWDFWLQLASKGAFKLVNQETAVYRANLGQSQISSDFDANLSKNGLLRIFEKWSFDFSKELKKQLHDEILSLGVIASKVAPLQALFDELVQKSNALRVEMDREKSAAIERDIYIAKCEKRIDEITNNSIFLERNAALRDDYIEEQRRHIEGLELLAKRQIDEIGGLRAAENALRDDVSALRAELADREVQHSRELALARDLGQEEVQALTRTLSWRVTRPLRRLRIYANRILGLKTTADSISLDGPDTNEIRRGTDLVAVSWKPHSVLIHWRAGLPGEGLSFPQTPKTVLVLPVYNGFQFLPPLFDSLEASLKGCSGVKLVVVDDCSTDARVLPWLIERVKNNPDFDLLRNDHNQGFVKSVNRGMVRALEMLPVDEVSAVVILNSDIELPARWLQRLCAPIVESPNGVASVTPMTNAGTICSFPRYLDDVEIPAGVDVQSIDDAFAPLFGNCVDAPTGVGFCMAINSAVLRKIGVFDDERYGRGYAEENDWCQRAIESGFVNVLQPGLFVWHKHGGSFDSVEKQQLVQRNLKLLGDRYPTYSDQVQTHIASNPLKLHRSVAALNYVMARRNTQLIIDHSMGGGANDYRKQLTDEKLRGGSDVIVYTEKFSATEVEVKLIIHTLGEIFEIVISDRAELLGLGRAGWIEAIFYNNAVTFRAADGLPSFLLEMVNFHGAELVVAIHDFYPVCPSYTLLDSSHSYCGVPKDLETCRRCLPKNSFMLSSTYPNTDIDVWRDAWGQLLAAATKILCFSESSKDIVLKAYPQLSGKDNLLVKPHVVDSLPQRVPRVDHYGPAVLGIVGAIGLQKGSRIIRRLAKIIESHNLNIRIVIIGECDIGDFPRNVTITGRYRPGDLPTLIEQHGVNFVALTSIWPETFSYVTSELMAMRLRILAFNLGAPPERLISYPSARIVDEVTAEALLEALVDWQKEAAEA